MYATAFLDKAQAPEDFKSNVKENGGIFIIGIAIAAGGSQQSSESMA